MIIGILFLVIPVLIGLVSYRLKKFEKRLFKKIPVIDWLIVIVFPFFAYIGIFLIIKSIITRPTIPNVDIETFDVLGILVFFFFYGFIGNSVHFVSKVLERFMDKNKHSDIYQINEIFHDKLSHYLSFICGISAISGIALLEINHPVEKEITRQQGYVIVLFGSLCGLAVAKGIFIWIEKLRRNNRALSTLCIFLFVTQINLIQSLHLKLKFYPYNQFIFAFLATLLTSFFLRHVMIILRLDSRRRLRYLAMLLSLNK